MPATQTRSFAVAVPLAAEKIAAITPVLELERETRAADLQKLRPTAASIRAQVEAGAAELVGDYHDLAEWLLDALRFLADGIAAQTRAVEADLSVHAGRDDLGEWGPSHDSYLSATLPQIVAVFALMARLDKAAADAQAER